MADAAVKAKAPEAVNTAAQDLTDGFHLVIEALNCRVAACLIPDSGHLSTLEQPQAVTAALVEWMRS